MTTDKPKAPRKSPASWLSLTISSPLVQLIARIYFSGKVLNGLVTAQAEHILHDHRPDYEKNVRGYCRTADEIASEMVRRLAA